MATDPVVDAVLEEFREAIQTAKYWFERGSEDEEMRQLELKHLYGMALVAGQMARLLGRIPIDPAFRIAVAQRVDDGLRELRTYSDVVPTTSRDGIIKNILKHEN